LSKNTTITSLGVKKRFDLLIIKFHIIFQENQILENNIFESGSKKFWKKYFKIHFKYKKYTNKKSKNQIRTSTSLSKYYERKNFKMRNTMSL